MMELAAPGPLGKWVETLGFPPIGGADPNHRPVTMKDFGRVVDNAKRRGVTVEQMNRIVDRADELSKNNEYLMTLLAIMAIDTIGPEEEPA